MHLASAQLGRADPVLHPQGERRAAPAHRRTDGRGGGARRAGGHRSLVQARRRRAAGRRGRAVRQEPRHPGRVVRLRHHPLARAARFPRRPGAPQRSGGRPLSGRFRPAPRLVPFLPADRLRHRRPRAVQGTADPRLHRRRAGPQAVQVARQRGRAAKGDRQHGRRHPAPVGSIDRLLRRDGRFRPDPAAQCRRLPPHPQHRALHAGQPQRFRPGQGPAATRADARPRPLGGGRHRAPAGRADRGLRRVPLLERLLQGAQLLRAGAGRLLPGHHQGPPVHHGGRQRGASLLPERAVPHLRGAGALGGADPGVHRRGNLAVPAG